MLGKLCRCGLLLLTVLALSLPLAGVCARAEETPDAPPIIIWLDGDYDSAGYLGCGVVKAKKWYIMQEKGGLRGSINTIINLNSEVIPLLNGVYLGERFYEGYILGGAYQKGFGLYDREGNTVVPLTFETEEEAWAQVGLAPSPYSYSEFPKLVSIEDPDYDPSVEYPSGDSDPRFLYGVMAEDGTMLIDYQKYNVWFDEDTDYSGIVENGRCGLMKNPLKKDRISSWAAAEVNAALNADLVPSRCAGYYTFEITRSQMAALLVQYSEYTLGRELPLPAEHPFTDTRDVYIEKAYAAGIVQGMGEGLFAPDKVVTREQLATMLYRAITHMDPEWTGDMEDPPAYTDFDQVSPWAKEAVSSLIAQKVMNGVSATRISPKTYCTTEQAILLVYRLVVGG